MLTPPERRNAFTLQPFNASAITQTMNDDLQKRITEAMRDPKNLGVVITVSGRPKFSEAGIDDPTSHFSGQTIRVHGVVIRKEKGPYIEVSDPSQIELVE